MLAEIAASRRWVMKGYIAKGEIVTAEEVEAAVDHTRKEIKERERSLTEKLDEIARSTHAGYALIMAARLDQTLRAAIERRMPYLTENLRRALFEHGALSDFSDKIDIAFGLGIIDAETRRELHILRKMRNAFAHSPAKLHFGDNAIISFLATLGGYKKGVEVEKFVLGKFGDWVKAIEPPNIGKSLFE
jgi:DNA-binding MltR family transcriptional regulator